MSKKFIHDCRGNAVLEFVLVFPLFLGLFAGIITLAALLNDHIVAASAARDAGRVAIATADPEAGRAAGRKTLEAGGLGAKDVEISVSRPGSWTDTVTAEVSCRIPVLVPGFAALLGGQPWDNHVQYKVTTKHVMDKYLREPSRMESRCGDWYGCRGGWY